MKTYKCIAKKDSPAPEHVHATMFIGGEVYHCKKSIDGFADVSGKFRNSLGGFEIKNQAIKVGLCREHLVIVELNEELVYPPKVWADNSEGSKPYELYEKHKNDPVGTILVAFAGAPGIGRISHMITRVDKTGVYGVMIENTMQMLDPEDVI